MVEQRGRTVGLTFIEVLTTTAVFALLAVSVLLALFGMQGAVVRSEIVSEIRARAQRAMDRVTELASQASRADAAYTPLQPTTGSGSHGLRFRLVSSVDGATGTAVFDDTARVYIFGPDDGNLPCRGLIVGRGPTLDDIHALGSGPDGVLGTLDDVTSESFVPGIPLLELLVPETFTPRADEMFTVDMEPDSGGGTLRLTLRLNARGRDGQFLFEEDLVLSERVTLRQ